MAYDEKTAARLRELFIVRTDVVEKKMFGGLCFMVSGSMCCGLTEDGLMLRVGRDRYEEALAQPFARPMDFTGRPIAGMVYVDPKGYRTDAALKRWVQRGIEFVMTLPFKSGGPSRRRVTRKAVPKKR